MGYQYPSKNFIQSSLESEDKDLRLEWIHYRHRANSS